MSITLGLKGRAETVVTPEKTAAACGSGSLPVYGTPWMLALMEEAACNSLKDALAENQGSVGMGMELTHVSPTPVGMKVWAESELVAVEGKKLTFSVTAYDEAGVIGRCNQQRCLIWNDRFLNRCQNKGKR
ncbi:MAG: dihydrolipoamide acyltransferase [Clostridiales bacterium]|nr:dihydrolipoamide acyltransferase [Clostridiales bacterium]